VRSSGSVTFVTVMVAPNVNPAVSDVPVRWKRTEWSHLLAIRGMLPWAGKHTIRDQSTHTKGPIWKLLLYFRNWSSMKG
jgi:hypothetical protein